MINVLINAAHTSFSPGAVWGARNEHSDVLRFGRFLSFELDRIKDIHCECYTGSCKKAYSSDDIVIILHRGSNNKSCEAYGCDITVCEDADAQIQYEAYMLLESLTGEGGFRYRGVHTNTCSSPFRQMEKTGCKRTFLIRLGFIDNFRDNRIFDNSYEQLAQSLAQKINEIIKGDTNEA